MPPCLPLRCVPPSCRCSVAESPILQHAGVMSSDFLPVPGPGWCSAGPAWCAALCLVLLCCVVCCLVLPGVLSSCCAALCRCSAPGVLRCAGVRSVSFALCCCAAGAWCCLPAWYLPAWCAGAACFFCPAWYLVCLCCCAGAWCVH